MHFLIKSIFVDGTEEYEDHPQSCEVEEREDTCRELSGLLPNDDTKCIKAPFGVRLGKNGIQKFMVEVGMC